LAMVEATGECFYEAELYRLRGELMLLRAADDVRPPPDAPAAVQLTDRDPSGLAEPERCFRHAFDVASRRGAKSLELRAALSLARLLRDRGQPAEGQRLLESTFGW